jgi:hypothetical protein
VSADQNTNLSAEFSPLPISTVPDVSKGEWQLLIDALPNFVEQALQAPKP